MRVLFITIGAVYNFDNSGAYTDLLKRFRMEGHDVFVVGALERRNNKSTSVSIEHGIDVLRVRVGNITKTNLIEKGISTMTIGRFYERAICKYWKDIQFDLIMYTTPPITITNLVRKLKRKYNAFTYLLLKDVFPQNAIDLGMLSVKGFKGIIYKYFRHVEEQLYRISDKIGCMSAANVEYVLAHNNFLDKSKVEVCPNTIDVIDNYKNVKKIEILKKYNIPDDKLILLYGGNFGKPQNVPYIIEAFKSCDGVAHIHFVFCGSGTDFNLIEEYVERNKPSNLTIIKQLPYKEYTELIKVSDIGLLFLDYRFTIPNFPSRLLDYMNYGLPVIAATDNSTDVGKVIVDGNFGWWVLSENTDEFKKLIIGILENKEINNLLVDKSNNARSYLRNNFQTERAYKTIMNAIKDGRR